jgi:hypothetical protein
MSKHALITKVLEHPDKDELLAKLTIGVPIPEIHEWLQSKYSAAHEAKLCLSEVSLKKFQDNYLDIYSIIYEDISKAKTSIKKQSLAELELSLTQDSAYQNVVVTMANQELDIRTTVKNMCKAMETRFGQVFDAIQQDPTLMNSRLDRVFMDYAEKLGGILEKYYKFTEEPQVANVVNHNVTLQVVDQHMNVFHDVIKNVLSQIDLEASLQFMELFNQEMSKLKYIEKQAQGTPEARIAEAKLLNESINKKLNA